MEFFQTSGRNLLAAEKAAGVKHHVALSVVGTERLQASGYFRAKLAQEQLIKASPIPYSIVRATQFFEFVPAIAAGGTQGDGITLSDAMMQPIASADVAAIVADIAVNPPLNGMVNIAGPDPNFPTNCGVYHSCMRTRSIAPQRRAPSRSPAQRKL